MREDTDRLLKLLEGKRVVFVGLGVSNTGLIEQLAKEGVDLTACDRREEEKLDGTMLKTLREKGVRLLLGSDYPARFEGDVLFRTPGMYFGAPQLSDFRERGGVVTSETELFCGLCPCPIFAVTGSDGKTTTTTIIAELLRAEGYTTHLGGNIGRPVLTELENISSKDFAVLELSSFQLISMRCAPQVSVVTNMSPNHLDVHKDMDEYIAAKQNIYSHQDAFSTTVLGADSEITAGFAPHVRGLCKTFSLKTRVRRGAYLRGDGMLCRVDLETETEIVHRDEVRLPGEHNLANFLAAISAVGDMVKPNTAAEVARNFGGVEHRIEFVCRINGVSWYNDSIATSPTRAMAGLASFNQKIVLIAGGYDKNLSYEPLAEPLTRKVKLLILMGATAGKIQAALRAHPGFEEGKPAILYARDMAEAVGLAHRHSTDGDIVSLSPASASFDSYPNFEMRGRHYKELVTSYIKE